MLLVYYHKEGEGEGNVKLCRPREITSKCLHICDITKIHHTCTQKFNGNLINHNYSGAPQRFVLDFWL